MIETFCALLILFDFI